MAKKSSREQLIDSIMSNKYGSDDPKYDGSNRAFLESLSMSELSRMSDGDEFEDEFELEGEVRDIDFDEDELNY